MTQHAINMLDEKNKVINTIEPSGEVIRLDEEWTTVHEGWSWFSVTFPLLHCTYSSTTGLPEQKEYIYYIVSAMVANAFPDRHDFVFPAQIVRSEDRRTIIGCRAFACATDFLKTQTYEEE